MLSQIDCFKMHFKFFKYCGIWASEDDKFRHYDVYSKIFVFLFIVLFDSLITLNFFFMERQMDRIVEEMVLYFTVISIISKTFTFLIFPVEIGKILSMLESDIFAPENEAQLRIVTNAKRTNVFYWKMLAGFSVTSNVSHALVPFILHVTLRQDLYLPVCSYDFFTEEWKHKLIYPLYFYQIIGIHINMWYNVNIDSFFLGLLNLTTAQVDIVDDKLRKVRSHRTSLEDESSEEEEELYSKLKDCFIHYGEIANFCSLIEATFSATLFTQFNTASYVICVCLFRLTRPLTPEYLVFLVSYTLIMVLQTLAPCWFGHRISDKSSQLVRAAYACDWPSRSRRFRSSLRLFVERASRPLALTGGKIFPLMLTTFTSIANSAYSFYTLLRNVQNE